MKKLMEKNLKPAYEKMGFRKGSLEDFKRLMKERDRAVGLSVELKTEGERLLYIFHTPLFESWKGKLSAEEAISTFMDFKIEFLLGKGWKWKLKEHFWLGDERIVVEIEKV